MQLPSSHAVTTDNNKQQVRTPAVEKKPFPISNPPKLVAVGARQNIRRPKRSQAFVAEANFVRGCEMPVEVLQPQIYK